MDENYLLILFRFFSFFHHISNQSILVGIERLFKNLENFLIRINIYELSIS